MCISPIRIRHPTISDEFIDVPCGKCLECSQKRINELTFRLIEQMKVSQSAYFFTLTYNDESLPYMAFKDDEYIGKVRLKSALECLPIDCEVGKFSRFSNLVPCFCKKDVQAFIAAIRDEYRRYLKMKGYTKDEIKERVCKIKYFVSSEYGDTTLRPHYHGVLFGYPWNLQDFLVTMQKYWRYGFVSASLCNENRLYYCCKYSFKNSLFKPEGLSEFSERCFTLMSKGLGLCFLTDNVKNYIYNDETGQIHMYIHQNGKEKLIPRYYRKKVFVTDLQKQELKDFWNDFNEFELCPDSADPFKWRDECYSKKVSKVKVKLKKEKM